MAQLTTNYHQAGPSPRHIRRENEMATCKNCGKEFDINTEQDWMEADDGGDICGDCVRDAEANIMQPEYPDDPRIS